MGLSYLAYGPGAALGFTIVAMVGLLGGVLHQHPQLRDHLRQLPRQPGPGDGMLICETVAAGLLGMVGPMVATWMVSISGGVNVGGIRPLFFAGLVVTVGTFIVVLTQLSERRVGTQRGR